jgi:hypothetical protein
MEVTKQDILKLLREIVIQKGKQIYVNKATENEYEEKKYQLFKYFVEHNISEFYEDAEILQLTKLKEYGNALLFFKLLKGVARGGIGIVDLKHHEKNILLQYMERNKWIEKDFENKYVNSDSEFSYSLTAEGRKKIKLFEAIINSYI